MIDYLNKPATYDSQTVIQAARREIDRRAWTRNEDHDLDAHLQAARDDLTAYLADLDQRNQISGAVLSYLTSAVAMELEKVQEAAEADDADGASTRYQPCPRLGLERAVGIDIDPGCVELVQHFQRVDRQMYDLVFGPPGYDHSVLEALETERANVVNQVMFHLSVALRGCGYLHD
ncbi:hypothetical protein [Pseudomonas putida]